MKKKIKKMLASLLCASMVLSSCVVSHAEPAAQDVSANLALNKPVEASAEYSTMPASKAVDGIVNDVKTDRWSSEGGPEQWLMVDLQAESEIQEFRIVAQGEGDGYDNRIGQFKIEGTNNEDGSGLELILQSDDKTEEGFPTDYVCTLDEPVSYRFVKLTIQKLYTGAYPNVSLREFEVRGDHVEVQDPDENVALGKTAVASSEEAASVRAALAVDGDTESRTSRWGSDIGSAPHWIYVDLGEVMDVQTVKVFWEQRKATEYRIQTAVELDDWTDAKVFKDRPASLIDVIKLDSKVQARYVRLYIDSATAEDPDGGITWNAVSIYELEVYGGIPKVPQVTLDTVVNEIEVTQPTADTEKLEVTLPEYEGFTVEYKGTDYEQVIGADLTIYKPVVSTTVKASFKVTEDATGKYKFKEIEVTVPGTYTVEAADNAAPSILPELREWKGTSGTFAPTAASRIVIADGSLKAMANKFAEDYKEITGKDIQIVTADTANAGDFFFALTDDASKGLQEEGYLMTITDRVAVEAETATGAYWATRTILQSLKLTDNIPCGITRDYPLYKVRGFILDVARKTFTLDYLQQFVKEMSWYKMNDFQVHLNDNLIPVEDYTNRGKDPFEAYSAFRLESDVKKGGNNGLNKADLTSTDMFYTKDEFRDFIKDARVQGVNIVPEIDTPAHSLALTKVRPDLRHGLNGRENDHLALRDKYDECASFVKGIFNEYMDGKDPVFDDQTIIQVGADEYNADKEAYRKFADDMLGFVQDTGRTARIWGSLSQCRGTTPVRSEKVQMNLWNFGYANMDEMYDQGFDLINCNDGHYYIVPAAGYYYDYLYAGTMYDLAINSIGGVTIPAGDPQMVGGAFAVWNDMTDYLENGMSEYDIYDRSAQHIALFASKLWGKGEKNLAEAQAASAQLGDAPNTNFGYEVKAENGVILHETFDTVENPTNAAAKSADGKTVLELKGGRSYVTTGLGTVGLGNDLRVKVKRTSADTDEQILFESAYGTIKAVQKDTGKVGFSRENHDYSFDYTLPVDEWVELEFKNVKDVATLYVNGVLVDILGDNDKTSNEMADLTGNYKDLHATTMFPVEKIGSETNAFKGYVDDVRVGVNAEYASTMELDYAVVKANAVAADNAEIKALAEEAKVIFAKFAPTAAEISELTARINAALEDVEYAKADYSRVESYKVLIPDADTLNNVFTPESVAKLNRVLASIRYDLPAAMQSTVDGYEAALAEALNALETKTEANVNYVDNSTLKATADSYQSGEDPAKALDNNPGTMWHCDWNNTTMPHWIDFEMEKLTAVNGLTYLPRSGGGNGNLTKYEVRVSDDGVNYTVATSGTLPNNAAEKEIEFNAVTTKHVRLVYVEAVGNFGSAAEIKLHRANIAADIEGLNAVIAKAEALANDGYTEESWNALREKITEAKELAAGAPDANTVEVMKRELCKAMTSLVLNEKEEEDGLYKVTVNGTVVERAEYNTKVTITAPEAPENEKFAGWIVNGKMVSTDEIYSFYVAGDMDFVAEYAAKDDVVEQEPDAVLSNVIVTPGAAAGKYDIKFVAQLVVPEGYTIKEAGLVWSNKGAAYNDKTKLDIAKVDSDAGVKVTNISKISNTWQYSVTIKGVPASVECVPGRAYATLVKGDGTTVQSDIELGYTK